MGDYALAVAANMGMLAFLALSAYVVLVAGEISFGQQAFFAIGGYLAGLMTVFGILPLMPALLLAAAAGALSSAMLGWITRHQRGLYFSVSTLAAAEIIRLSLELLHFRLKTRAGTEIGPDGTAGFGDIRYVFEHNISQFQFVLYIYGLLALVILLLYFSEHRRFGIALRMAGEDAELAGALGIDVYRVKLIAISTAGAIAATGGGLFAHYNTYIEPGNFDMMLGIHGVSYALIGGLGTPFGPLLGVAVDILVLEFSRIFHGYRMIAFGGAVAILLILRPRGLLDERTVARLGAVARCSGPWLAAITTVARNRVPLILGTLFQPPQRRRPRAPVKDCRRMPDDGLSAPRRRM